MPSSNPARRLGDILENIERIRSYIDGMDETAFLSDEKTQDAVQYCLLRISEAASKLGGEAAALVPQQDWQRIRGLGNVLRHEYDQIEMVTIWNIAAELPALFSDVSAGLRRLPGN